MGYYTKEGKPCGVLTFFAELIFPARTFHEGKQCGVLTFFAALIFPARNLPRHSPFELRTRTFQKPTTRWEAKNKPKAHTFQKPTPDWDTIHRGENHVAFSLFLLSSFSQPEPSTTQPFWVTNQEASRSLQLKEKPKTNPKLKPSRSLHLNEMLYKGGKTMWRFHFFGSVSFPSQYLPRHSPFELRTRTFQKPTTRWEAKNKPKAHTFQKPTPDWDTIHRGENHVAFSCDFTFFAEFIFPARTFHNTALLSYEPRSFQKPTAQGEAKNKPKAKTFQKPTPQWDAIKRRENHVAFSQIFCSVSFPSQNLPQHRPGDLRTRTFQKPTAPWEAKNKPKAKTFQKSTPEWDTIKRRDNHVAF